MGCEGQDGKQNVGGQSISLANAVGQDLVYLRKAPRRQRFIQVFVDDVDGVVSIVRMKIDGAL